MKSNEVNLAGTPGSAGKRGFTLIEALLAAVLLAVLLIGLGAFFTDIIRKSDVVDEQTRAMQIARQGLEEIRTEKIASLPLGLSAPEVIDDFTRLFDIAVDEPLFPTSRRVRCLVTWNSAIGPDTVSFTALF